MNIFIGADHRGFAMKEGLAVWLSEQGHDVHDVGALEMNEGDDYPDYAKLVADEVTKNLEESRGILLCGSGVGVAIAANKVTGVRAGNIHDVEIAKAARNDDDINVLALGADYLQLDDAKAIIATFLQTPFSGIDRHQHRIEKIKKMEQK
jgi:ribose 5-phosphate isomerase B